MALMIDTSELPYDWAGDNGVNRLYQQFGIAEAHGMTDLASNVAQLAGLPVLFRPRIAWNYSVSGDVLGRLVFVDHGLAGRNRDRPGLREALAACRAGDTPVVTKLDRLARSLPDARDIVKNSPPPK